MFKESLSALASVVSGSVKQAVSEYKPTATNMGGAFTRIAHQGIANLSYRSPILADVASTMLQSFQEELINRDRVKQHVASDDSNGLRQAVSEKLGGSSSKEKVDAEMFKVIDKLRKLVDTEGAEAAKKSTVFAEFGKYFQDFRKAKSPENTQPSGPAGMSADQLARIEINTQKTALLLAEMSPEGGLSATAPSVTPAPNNSFIDPLTGLPSIKAAIGTIGGTFLAKVFDDEAISKYADKAKAKLFGKAKHEAEPVNVAPVDPSRAPTPDITPEAATIPRTEIAPAPIARKIVPRADRQEENIKSILKGLSLDLGPTAPSESFVPVTEQGKEAVAQEDKRATTSNTLLTKIISELQRLNEKSSSVVEPTMLDKVKSLASGGLGSTGGMISKGAKLLGPAALVAGAGAAGFGLGTLANPLIDKAVSSMSGEENSLGTWIYNKTHPSENLEAKKSTQVTAIQRATDEKIKASVVQKNIQQPPIMLNTPVVTNNNSSTIIANSSVRNQESTFERVQFQDFWSRVG